MIIYFKPKYPYAGTFTAEFRPRPLSPKIQFSSVAAPVVTAQRSRDTSGQLMSQDPNIYNGFSSRQARLKKNISQLNYLLLGRHRSKKEMYEKT